MKTSELTDALKKWNVSESVSGRGKSWQRVWTICAPAPKAEIYQDGEEFVVEFKGAEIGRRPDKESAFQYAMLYLSGV